MKITLKLPPKGNLKRFTTIGSAIDTLRNKRIAFLDPEKWDDRNDAEFMRLYRETADCPNLKALCCTESGETYHHWKVFTSSADGCFIEFSKENLLRDISENDSYFYSDMQYVRFDEDRSEYNVGDLPFLKRAGFRDEKEFRIIYTGQCDDDAHFMPIELGWITRIVLNPWLPPPVAKSVIDTFREISGRPKLAVTASKLTNSQTWTRWGERIVKRAATPTKLHAK